MRRSAIARRTPVHSRCCRRGSAWTVAVAFCAAALSGCGHQAASGDIRGATVLEQLLETQEPMEPRTLEIGFAIGYLGTAVDAEEVLRLISADGFEVVRAFEPFSPRDDANHTGMMHRLKIIVESGLTPFLALSNYPYELLPDPAQQAQLGSSYPEDKRERVLTYSNRYAPRDLDRYRGALRHMLDQLDSEFGRDELLQWYFEIGNEPNAPLYFWGAPQDFREIFSTAAQVIKDFDSHLTVGAGGFTSSLVADSAQNLEYYRLARDLASSPLADFTSFHLYPNAFDGAFDKNAVTAFGGDAERKIVSEWNISSVSNATTESILNSTEFFSFLIDAVVVCYHADVELLLIHKLMDRSIGGRYQLGIFDRQGQPKTAYRYVRLMLEITRSQFTAVEAPTMVLIRGRDAVVALSRNHDNPFDYSGYEILESSFSVQPEARVLPAGEWVVLRRTAVNKDALDD